MSEVQPIWTVMTIQICTPPPCSFCWVCHFPSHMWLSGHNHSDSRDLPHSGGGTRGASASRLCNKPSRHCSNVCRLVDGTHQHSSHSSWYCGASSSQSHCCRGKYVYVCSLLVFDIHYHGNRSTNNMPYPQLLVANCRLSLNTAGLSCMVFTWGILARDLQC